MGNTDLMGGLNFIVVLIGLFAIPEIISYARHPSDEHMKVRCLGKDSVTFAEYKRCFKTICRGGVIGAILGSIPGIGAAPAAFLSYSEARRSSPNKSNFGKGELEGVAASESGNNGVCGSTLIPLLALGIPGDVVTAIIIGAFMIHGIQPGPLLFQNNADLIYALFMGLILSSFFLLVIGGFSIRIFKHVADIPKSILLPSILVLCVYGGFAVNNSLFDVMVMFVLGGLGYVMLRSDLPAAPFLIAFVLGPLLEDNFRQSMLMSGGDLGILFRSAITWVFWGLTLATTFFLVKSHLKERKVKKSNPTALTGGGSTQ
jgi:putative tricarboxylic transport membrane protein